MFFHGEAEDPTAVDSESTTTTTYEEGTEIEGISLGIPKRIFHAKKRKEELRTGEKREMREPSYNEDEDGGVRDEVPVPLGLPVPVD